MPARASSAGNRIAPFTAAVPSRGPKAVVKRGRSAWQLICLYPETLECLFNRQDWMVPKAATEQAKHPRPSTTAAIRDSDAHEVKER